MRRRWLAVPGLLAAAAAYLAFAPSWVDPVVWTPARNPGWTGVFAPDSSTPSFERIPTGVGPEDVAVGPDGFLYTGLADGRIVRFTPEGSAMTEVADTGGRPLGLGFDSDGRLIVADRDRGLLRVTRDGEVVLLTDRAGGTRIGFADDLDIDGNGVVWFSDMTTRWPDDIPMDCWEGSASGRLLTYDASTRETRVHTGGLQFPNGVALGPGGHYVLVGETFAARITRIWIDGPRAGEREPFLDALPGCVDNVSYNGRGLFWVALVGSRSATFERFATRPLLRRVLTRVPGADIPHPLPWLRSGRYDGCVLAVDTTGAVRASLHDPGGYGAITSVNEVGGALFAGSIIQPAVARIPLQGLDISLFDPGRTE